jgi:hypothetical protein
MGGMGSMNILSALFGIFRQRGLVTTIKENGSLVGFALSGTVFSIIGGVLYGFAMGVGLGIDTAVKDAIKVGLIVVLGLPLSIPIFWVAYRLLGRQERPAHVAAVPLTLGATVSIILAVTAPIVFMLSVLAGFSTETVYIHVVIVDVALLVGLYLAGMLVYHSFSDQKQLIIPNVVGFVMMAVILVVLTNFLGPFLAPRSTFSVGTDRLKDGLGIGVAEQVDRALVAATSADRVSYRYQTTNDNGDLVRDYTVTRVGSDYLIEIHLHAVPGETFLNQQRIWVLDDRYYTDFDDGRIAQTTYADLSSFLDPALPAAAFTLPAERGFAAASWRAYESDTRYTAIGTSQTMARATLVLEAATGRLSALTVGSAERGLHAEVRVNDILSADLDRAALEATLSQATVVGSMDRSDAAKQDYVQDEAFFAVRYPRTWRASAWDSAQRQVKFTTDCGASEGCSTLIVSVYDLAEGKGPRQYAEDLGSSLDLQPEYREIKISTMTFGDNDQTVGVVEYLFDRTVKGEIETTHHIEYIFEGQTSRYHLDFAAPAAQFEAFRGLFEEIAGQFTYLTHASR